MPLAEVQHQISEAYLWHRALGNDVAQGSYCRFVTCVDTPDIWMANHVQSPRAQSPDEISVMLAEMDTAFAHCSHRMVLIDQFAPDQLVAQLFGQGYRELDATVMMLLEGALAIPPKVGITFRPVTSDAEWDIYLRLSRVDHGEGKKTFHMELPEEITRALMADTQRKTSHMTVYLAELEDEPLAFGASVDCPNGLGMIEDLFTLPAHRGNGIASALIAHIVKELRQSDSVRPIFLGALAHEGAKHLYKQLGFEPVMVARELILGA